MQLLKVDLIVLAALALMLNRDRLPASWKPEMRLQPGMFDRMIRPMPDNVFTGLVYFGGQPTLIVGDSLAAHWPINADFMWNAGEDPGVLAERLAPKIAERRYELGIVACGTGCITRREPAQEWLPDLDRLIALVAEHADRVIVMTPVPGLLQPDGSVREYAIEAEVADYLQATWTDHARVFHTAAFYREYPKEPLREDHCHLTEYGFTELLERLDLQHLHVNVPTTQS